MHNARIFVSGGTGVIGTHLVNMLLEAGADIFVGDLKSCPKEWLGKVKYRQGDLNDIRKEELLDFNPHYFFHLAATFERSVESYPFFNENFQHNIKLSHHLIDCLKESWELKKVVFASSYLIYDSKLYQATQPLSPVLLNENSFIFPRNICGAAKLFHEEELKFINQFAKDKLSIISARIFRVYGKNSRDVISRWIRMALREEPLTVYNSHGFFDYIYADDVAKGLIKLANTTYEGVINLGSGHARSISDVIHILKRHFPKLKYHEEPSDELIESSQADMRKFHEVTGWMPEYHLEKAIPLIIQHEKEKLDLQTTSEEYPALLVTSISKKVSLIQSLRNAVNKLGHFSTIHGCDSDNHCLGKYAVDAFWETKLLENMTFEDILSYCQTNKIKAIIPTRDGELQFFANNKEDFSKKGIKVLTSSPDAINKCLDKLLFVETLSKNHLPVIPTSLNIDVIKTDRFVVKERFGAGSQKIGLNLSKEDALQHAKGLENPIFQPYIKGQEWSVDLYLSAQGKVMGAVARERNLIIGGESQVTTTATYPALEKLCHQISHLLNLYGPVVMQILEDDQGNFHIIECNPRFGGASTASVAVGLDCFYWFLLEAMGQSIEEYPFMRRQSEIRQIRYPSDWILPWS